MMVVGETQESLLRLAAEPLIRSAWSDAGSLEVLIDKLLEAGFIREWDAVSSPLGVPGEEKNFLLWGLECDAREWILKPYALEVRVTGYWPDVCFVVYRNDRKEADEKGTTTLHERVPFEGVVKQPRLLGVKP